jgi:hypothetical protein
MTDRNLRHEGKGKRDRFLPAEIQVDKPRPSDKGLSQPCAWLLLTKVLLGYRPLNTA